MLVIPARGMLRQKDCESSLGHIVTFCLKKLQGEKQTNKIRTIALCLESYWIHCSLSQNKLMVALSKRRLLNL